MAYKNCHIVNHMKLFLKKIVSMLTDMYDKDF